MKNRQLLKSCKGLLFSLPIALSAIAVPIAAEAMSIKHSPNENAKGNITSLEPIQNDRRNGRESEFIFEGTGFRPIRSTFKIPNSGTWFIAIDNTDGNRNLNFTSVGKVGQNPRKIKFSIGKGQNYEGDFFPKGTYRLTSNKGSIIRKGKTVTLDATNVPEPFSTTAAVGLAIAGATHTLKKKRTEDA